MKINIISDTDRRLPRKKINCLIALMEEEEEPPVRTINLIFTRDRRMARLNQKYRNLNKSTDVLSFNIDDENGPDAVLGEIYISTDRAQANLKNFGTTFHSELLRLCCHGFLHLLGYDHQNEKDRAAMQKREQIYLDRLARC